MRNAELRNLACGARCLSQVIVTTGCRACGGSPVPPPCFCVWPTLPTTVARGAAVGGSRARLSGLSLASAAWSLRGWARGGCPWCLTKPRASFAPRKPSETPTAVSPFAHHAAGSPVPCVVRWPAAARWTCSPVSTAQLMTFTAVVKSSTPAPSPPRATAVPRPSPAVCLFGRPPFRAGSLSGILSGPPSSLSEMPFLASGRCSFRYPRAIFGALRSENYRVPVMVRDPCFARELMIC